jgi:predicted enzyme related to lactoylglutathione lyase
MGRPIVKIDIGCADRPATLRFYQELFGWGAETGPHTVELDLGVAAPPALSASITSLGHEPHQYVMFYVDVDDIPACLDRAETLGGKRHLGPIDLPQGGRFAWLSDPGGNLVGLVDGMGMSRE